MIGAKIYAGIGEIIANEEVIRNNLYVKFIEFFLIE